MEQRLSLITLGVSNLKTSREFYDRLGWQVASEEQAEEIVAYNLQSMCLALYPLDKLMEDTTVPATRTGYSTVTLAYNVNSGKEVDAMLEEAGKAGGEIVKTAAKVFWGGYSGYFADPDKYLWEVAFNPFSPLGPNGEFQWGGVNRP